ncbi:hypothetical protein [Candidatus Palauibacter sp.]|uniref:hypothetical protein n=1 Tax=Candidatus Palauibacter sp. TaxID=3101350 RepID=UPI003AF24483
MRTISKLVLAASATQGLALALCVDLAAQRISADGGGPPASRLIALLVSGGSPPEALLVDAVRNRVVAILPTGPDARDVALSPDGRFAYVTSYGWEPGTEDRAGNTPLRRRGVTVIDLEERQVHAVFQPADYRQLGAIAVGEGGDRLWVTSEAENGVVELDAHTGEVRMLWKTGGSDPADIAVSDDGDHVFTANAGSDDVMVIDRVTVISTRVPAGRRPAGVAVAPGGRLWVANSGENTISVIGNFRSPREMIRFPSGGIEPVSIAFHPDRSEAWVSHRTSRTIAVLGLTSGRRIAGITLPGEPGDITFSDDGARAYVSSPANGEVYTIDVELRRFVDPPPAIRDSGGA